MPSKTDSQPIDRLQAALNELLKAAKAKDVTLTNKQLDAVTKILDHRRMCVDWAVRFREANPNPNISAKHVIESARMFESYIEGSE